MISRQVPDTLRRVIRGLLLSMHTEPFGKAMLERARFKRFVAAEDGDYNPIRAMASSAARVSFA